MNMTAIITGITGQDGAYLSQLLLRKGYRVVGLVRKEGEFNRYGLAYLGIDKDVIFERIDLLDKKEVAGILRKYQPDSFYHLAAQSSVHASFQNPLGTIEFNTFSTLNVLRDGVRFRIGVVCALLTLQKNINSVPKAGVLPIIKTIPMIYIIILV